MISPVIDIQNAPSSRLSQVDFNNLEFGKYVSDHILVMYYKDGSWSEPEIGPFRKLEMAPNMLGLHYGQVVFEGMKAFKMQDERVSIFRIEAHYQRFMASLDRLCMPPIDFSVFEQCIKNFVITEKDWIPDTDGASLYLRPFMFASEERFGVKISDEYTFVIFGGPVGPYYNKPLKVKLETDFIRAARGGTGAAKCAGNYGGAFYPSKLAKAQGYDQVIWTTGLPEFNIEESGTMNLMFVIDGQIITPPLSDSILGGITRNSVLCLAQRHGYTIVETSISAHELVSAFEAGSISEAFGTGTAALTSAISLIHIQGKDFHLPAYNSESFCMKARYWLEQIRLGNAADTDNWNTIV